MNTITITLSPLHILIDSLAEPYVIVPGLREGEMGNLTCTVPAPCPSNSPNVTWDSAFGGNITQWTQLNADGTQNVSAILNFVPSIHHHELKVNCVSIHLLDRQDKPLLSQKTVILNVECEVLTQHSLQLFSFYENTQFLLFLAHRSS